jgi:hypothetical protein
MLRIMLCLDVNQYLIFFVKTSKPKGNKKSQKKKQHDIEPWWEFPGKLSDHCLPKKIKMKCEAHLSVYFLVVVLAEKYQIRVIERLDKN